MNVYWRIFVFYFQRFLAYPWEVVALVLRRVLILGFLLIFWTVVSRTEGSGINVRELLAYFLIATSLNGWVMAVRFNYAQFLNSLIKRGEMSTFLIRPAAVIPATAAASFGMNGVDLILGVVTLTVSWIIAPPASTLGLCLFFIYLLPAVTIATALNLLVGAVSFWTVEASSFRHVIAHVVRVFSGSLIPLAFFPGSLQSLVTYLPFGSMISTPATAIRLTSFSRSVWISMSVSFGWAIALGICSYVFWNISIKRYEAVGI